MKKLIYLISITLLITNPSHVFAADFTGGVCKKTGEEKIILKDKYKCKTKGKKKIWVKQSSNDSSRAGNDLGGNISNQIPIYKSGPGATPGSGIKQSAELSFTPTIPNEANLKLWVFDPEYPSRALGSNGIFFKKGTDEWKWLGGNADGTVFASWATGEYTIHTVEPNNNTLKYSRKTYLAVVDDKQNLTITGLKANSQGIFTLTIDLKSQTNSSFSPQSECQLLGQNGNQDLNSGFPRREERLPNQGIIRAIIIPVDFPDVIASGNPAEDFFSMAKGNDDFYQRQSGGKVRFSYQIYPTYIRMPFLSTKHQLGTWNSGDSLGYWKSALAAADSFVDYSLFDVVYVLSPKNIPRSSMAYGPAFPIRIETEDGYVKNGTFSAADAYQPLYGAEWKWLAHETGHLFGMHDLYVAKPNPETFGSWDLMSLNWSVEAIELSAWNRYTQGWLEENQVSCIGIEKLSSVPLKVSLSPLVENSSTIRAQFVRLSSTKILVMEYRKTAGLDNIISLNQGVLVYTVDMTTQTMKGGWQVQRRPGSERSDLTDAALKAGDKIVVSGISIKVNAISAMSADIELATN